MSSHQKNNSKKLSVERAIKLARKASRENQTDKSFQICSEILNRYPNNKKIRQILSSLPYRVYFDKANIQVASHNFESALINYQKALTINPKIAEAHFNIGNIYKDLGKLDLAVKSYKTALELKPKFYEAMNNLGITLSEKGELDSALRCYADAITIDRKRPELYYNIGNALSEKKDLQAALDNYKLALEINPEYPAPYFNIGNICLKSGYLQRALENYECALELDPNEVSYFNMLDYIELQILGPSLHQRPRHLHRNVSQHILINDKKHQILQAIYFFLAGDVKSSEEYLQKFDDLENSKSGSYFDRQDQIFCQVYRRFISELILKKPPHMDVKNTFVYHLGESHSLSYAHSRIDIKNKSYSVCPKLIFGAKAYHFTNIEEKSYQSIAQHILREIPKKSIVFISFGEIDCRFDEGIIAAFKKSDLILEHIISKTVKEYVSWFLVENINNYHEYYFFNVPAPVFNMNETTSASLEVAEVVKIFNDYLAESLTELDANIIDVYKHTVNAEGFSNGLFHCDKFHLDNRILPLISEQLS